jgi:hypothetical protein
MYFSKILLCACKYGRNRNESCKKGTQIEIFYIFATKYLVFQLRLKSIGYLHKGVFFSHSTTHNRTDLCRCYTPPTLQLITENR